MTNVACDPWSYLYTPLLLITVRRLRCLAMFLPYFQTKFFFSIFESLWLKFPSSRYQNMCPKKTMRVSFIMILKMISTFDSFNSETTNIARTWMKGGNVFWSLVMFVLESYKQTEKKDRDKQSFRIYPPGESARCLFGTASNRVDICYQLILNDLDSVAVNFRHSMTFLGSCHNPFLKFGCLHSPLDRKVIWKPKTGHRNRRGTTRRKTDTQLCICFGIKSWVYLSLWDLIHHLIKDVFSEVTS